MSWSRLTRATASAVLVVGLGAVAATGSAAADATGPTPPFTQCPSAGLDASCGILLDVTTDNSVSVLVDPSVGPYDGGDDTLVGIVNQSSSPVTAVTVDGPGTDLSGFDYDGICDTYYGYGRPAGCPFGLTGYEGPGTSFLTDPSLPDEAEVDFSPALAPGQSAYFSLEGALKYAHLTARQGPLEGPLIHYVGMGDSFSSGESNPPYQTFSSIEPNAANPYNSAKDGCHRSSVAYPEHLMTDLPSMVRASDVDLQFIACSGATTDQMLGQTNGGKGSHKEDPQVDQLKDIEAKWAGPADLVTWTAAGDDIGFSKILVRCLWKYQVNYPESCSDDSSWVATIQHTLDAEEPRLEQNYARLAAGTGSQTSILIADYPQIFPGNTGINGQDCDKLFGVLSHGDQNLFRSWTTDLDSEIGDAVRADGLNFVDVLADGSFDGHAVCQGNADFNALTDNNANGIWQHLEFWRTADYSGSFHPNANGQLAYATAFEDYIAAALASGAARTQAGLPANPGPSGPVPFMAGAKEIPSVPSPSPSSGTDETLIAGPLTVTTQSSTGCADLQTYQGGQIITVTGGGYAPGSDITVTIQPGTTEQVVDHATADDSGQISLTIRLPLGLTGPQPVTDMLPMGYIEANGPGATSTTQMDNVMFNIAPHGSSCGPIDTLPFDGFDPPVSSTPAMNATEPGRTIPVKFELPEVPGTVENALWPSFPQTTPVSCTDLSPIGPAIPAVSTSAASRSGASDHYNYLWSTDPSWTGCRELDLRLADGTNHIAYFSFGGG